MLANMGQSLQMQNSHIPPVFRTILVEQIWDDGPAVTESLSLLADDFAQIIAGLNEHEIENAARDWAATFPYQEPLQVSPAYQALWQLQEVAQDSVAQRRSLILYLAGHLLF